MADWIQVAQKDQIENGKCKIVDVDGAAIAIFHIEGEYFAVEDRCTHDDIEFCANAIVEGKSIVCPWHGARFAAATGGVEAPPAYEPLTTFPIRILDDGAIEVQDDRWD